MQKLLKTVFTPCPCKPPHLRPLATISQQLLPEQRIKCIGSISKNGQKQPTWYFSHICPQAQWLEGSFQIWTYSLLGANLLMPTIQYAENIKILGKKFITALLKLQMCSSGIWSIKLTFLPQEKTRTSVYQVQSYMTMNNTII